MDRPIIKHWRSFAVVALLMAMVTLAAVLSSPRDTPEPRGTLLNCPPHLMYVPETAPSDYALSLEASLRVSHRAIEVTYSVSNHGQQAYIVYKNLGFRFADGNTIADPNAVQVDFDGRTLFFKKQDSARCLLPVSDPSPLLSPEPVTLPPGAVLSETFAVPRPVVVNYEPRANALLASAREGLMADFRRRIGWPIPPLEAAPTAQRTARRVGIGIGVAPAKLVSIREQRVLFRYIDLDEEIEVMTYTVRKAGGP